MRWFGPSWDAPVNETTDEMEVPVDEQCERCQLPIAEHNRGVEIPYIPGRDLLPIPLYYHLQCFYKEVGIPDAAHLPGVHDHPSTTPSDGTDRPG